ncbi:MAG: hypothetical protein ABEI86_02310 [Halobacteriaceae archaeon]
MQNQRPIQTLLDIDSFDEVLLFVNGTGLEGVVTSVEKDDNRLSLFINEKRGSAEYRVVSEWSSERGWLTPLVSVKKSPRNSQEFEPLGKVQEIQLASSIP